MYGEDLNPLEDNPSPFSPVMFGFGTEIDLCEPGHARLYVAMEELAELGYVKKALVLVDYRQQLWISEGQ